MAMAVESTPKQKAWPTMSNTAKSPRLQKQYSFKNEHIVTMFNLLSKRKMLKLPESRRPEEAGKTNDLNYCQYHRIVGHPTKNCFILKDKIQALIDARAFTSKLNKKGVRANSNIFNVDGLKVPLVLTTISKTSSGRLI